MHYITVFILRQTVYHILFFQRLGLGIQKKSNIKVQYENINYNIKNIRIQFRDIIFLT